LHVPTFKDNAAIADISNVIDLIKRYMKKMKNSNKQYPAQTGKYIVKVKNGRGWNNFSTARFHISVGQDYHEGDKFEATMKWATYRFDKVIICVNDTLQRHNYMYRENLCGIAAYNKAEAAGREWIERNYKFIQSLSNYEITRWDEWRSNAAYDEQYEKIIDLYNSRHDFRELINIEIMEFWKRRRLKEGSENLSDFDGFKKNVHRIPPRRNCGLFYDV
jgi:hypothetical protein